MALDQESISAIGGLVMSGVVKIAAVFGAVGGIWAIYTNSGLPIPATIQQVEIKVSSVVDRIVSLEQRIDSRMKGFERVNLEGQRGQIRSQRVPLINERHALEQALPTAPEMTKQSLRRRIEEIGLQLEELTEDDARLRRRIDELGGSPNEAGKRS